MEVRSNSQGKRKGEYSVPILNKKRKREQMANGKMERRGKEGRESPDYGGENKKPTTAG